MKILRAIWTGLPILLLALTAHSQTATYDGVDPYEEFGKRLKEAQEVTPLTSDLFGDSVSLYNGSTEFNVVDISIPGNSSLPVELRRRRVIEDQRLDPGSSIAGFGDWDADVPYISGTFTQANGWQLSDGSYNRCTDTVHYINTTVPIPGGLYPTGTAPYAQVWSGNQLHIPGGGDEELLVNNQAKSPAYASSSSYPWVTKGNYRLSCLSSVQNGLPGEGFVAVSPDGVSYTFNWAVVRNAPQLAWAYSTTVKPTVVPREKIYLLATHVQDRFGNWVSYTYSGSHLTKITSSDNRTITLTWNGDVVQSVASALGTWNYAYGSDANGNPLLSLVTLPDSSKWTYSVVSGTLRSTKNAWPNNPQDPTPKTYCQVDPDPNSGSYVYSVGAPSGAQASFDFEYVRHYRNSVPWSCPGNGNSLQQYPSVFDFSDNYSLVSKTITGAGLAAQHWTYQYLGPVSGGYYTASTPWSYNNNAQPYVPSGSCSTCALSTVVEVTDPTAITKYTFGMQYARNEGQLLGTEVDNLSGGVLSVTSNSMMSTASASNMSFPAIAGQSMLPNFQSPLSNQTLPVTQKIIAQDGDVYTLANESFDAFARVTKTRRSNNISGQAALEEQMLYQDDLANWVLGLLKEQDNVGTGEVERNYTYTSGTDTVYQSFKFGELIRTYAFDALGNLASYTDGNNRTTSFGSYKGGIPQTISFPDQTAMSIAVDDAGQITSVKNQAGYTTGYQYYPGGRIKEIDYPAGDVVAWAPKAFTYDYVPGTEHGIAAYHWRRTVSHGDARSVTYFDAELRPILSDTYLSSDGNSHTSVRTDYDWRSQKIFASYPQAGALNLTDLTTGTTTQYDALGRVTKTLQDSELGTLTSTTGYLSGARVQVTDPKNKVTTTTYQVFDQPSYNNAILVQAPDGINQAITRDVYGNPLSIRQYGSYNNLTSDLTKYLYYDSYHRHCRTAEPESGSTVMHYDNANNVDWTADGLSISGMGCGQSSVADAAKTARSYDAMNRVKTLVPPAGTQSTQYTYDALGNVQTAVSGVSTWSAGLRNGLGLPTSETLQITGLNAWTLGYAYDANGNLSSVSYPDSTSVAYAPDALGRPTQAGVYATGVTYFPSGEVSAFTFGNGALYAAQQNARKLLSNFSYAKGSTLNVSEDYVYDNNANITNVNDLTGGPRTKSFGYDDLNRLTGATATNLWGTEGYTYDPLNNIASRTGASTTVTYAYDQANRLTAMSDGTTFGYDNRGNVASKNGVALTFDAKNQLQNVGGSVAYAYDASGRRVSKTPITGGATYYFYSQAGQLMYQWEPSSAKATDYVYLGKRMLARNESYSTQVAGTIDGAPIDGSGNATLTGWACSTHLDQSIGVEVFVGGASGAGGVRIATATANVASEPAVASACQANGSNYRFSIALTDAMRSQYGGQAIYVYGDSPVGNGNLALNQSGTYTVPVPAVSGAPTITSPITGSTNTSGSYTVAWSAVTGAASYTLEEQVNGGVWSPLPSSSETSLAVSGKGNGTYDYQVEACNSSGCGAWSTVISTTVLLPPPAPASITVPTTSSGSIGVSWVASSTATSYTVQQSLNGGVWSTVYGGSGTSTTVSEPATGSYSFRVEACNASCSGWTGSNAVAVTIPPSSAPALTAPSSNNTGSYTVSWTSVNGASSYTLQQQVNGGGWTTIQASAGISWSASGKGNATYGYRAQACNGGGCGPWSGTSSVVVLLPPGTPGSISVPASSTGSIGVSWAASSTATSYTLQQSLNGGSPSTVYNGGATSTTLSVGASGSYAYQVRACNGGGCSGWKGSSAVQATVSIPLSINGQSYDNAYAIPLRTQGYSTIGFSVLNGNSWEVYGASPSGNVVKASGALPVGAVTVQYTWALIGAPAGDVDSAGTLTNSVTSPTAVSSNPSSHYTTATYGPTSGSHGRSYQVKVNFYNAAGANVSSSTCTLTAETEGSN